MPTIALNNIEIEARAEAAVNANMILYAIDDEISAEWEPVEAAEIFGPDVGRLYFFLRYENMTRGVAWRWELERDGDVVGGRTLLWGAEGSGQTFFFLRLADGFAPGIYDLRIFIGDDDAANTTIMFAINEDA